jgi:ribonuclease P protein component
MQTPNLDVRFAASAQSTPRVGLIVPRHKHSAVDRNRLRRRLRELIRVELLPAVARGDAMIRAKADAYELSFDGLRREIGSIKSWIAALEQR